MMDFIEPKQIYCYPWLTQGAKPIEYRPCSFPRTRLQESGITEAKKMLARYMARKLSPATNGFSTDLNAALKRYVDTGWYDIFVSGPSDLDVTLLFRTNEAVIPPPAELGAPQIRSGDHKFGTPSLSGQQEISVILPERSGIPFFPDMDGNIFLSADATEEQLRKLSISEAWQSVCEVIIEIRQERKLAAERKQREQANEESATDAQKAHDALLAATTVEEKAEQDLEELLAGLNEEKRRARLERRSKRNEDRRARRYGPEAPPPLPPSLYTLPKPKPSPESMTFEKAARVVKRIRLALSRKNAALQRLEKRSLDIQKFGQSWVFISEGEKIRERLSKQLEKQKPLEAEIAQIQHNLSAAEAALENAQHALTTRKQPQTPETTTETLSKPSAKKKIPPEVKRFVHATKIVAQLRTSLSTQSGMLKQLRRQIEAGQRNVTATTTKQLQKLQSGIERSHILLNAAKIEQRNATRALTDHAAVQTISSSPQAIHARTYWTLNSLHRHFKKAADQAVERVQIQQETLDRARQDIADLQQTMELRRIAGDYLLNRQKEGQKKSAPQKESAELAQKQRQAKQLGKALTESERRATSLDKRVAAEAAQNGQNQRDDLAKLRQNIATLQQTMELRRTAEDGLPGRQERGHEKSAFQKDQDELAKKQAKASRLTQLLTESERRATSIQLLAAKAAHDLTVYIKENHGQPEPSISWQLQQSLDQESRIQVKRQIKAAQLAQAHIGTELSISPQFNRPTKQVVPVQSQQITVPQEQSRKPKTKQNIAEERYTKTYWSLHLLHGHFKRAADKVAQRVQSQGKFLEKENQAIPLMQEEIRLREAQGYYLFAKQIKGQRSPLQQDEDQIKWKQARIVQLANRLHETEWEAASIELLATAAARELAIYINENHNKPEPPISAQLRKSLNRESYLQAKQAIKLALKTPPLPN